jgi:hypothetical protein
MHRVQRLKGVDDGRVLSASRMQAAITERDAEKGQVARPTSFSCACLARSDSSLLSNSAICHDSLHGIRPLNTRRAQPPSQQQNSPVPHLHQQLYGGRGAGRCGGWLTIDPPQRRSRRPVGVLKRVFRVAMRVTVLHERALVPACLIAALPLTVVAAVLGSEYFARSYAPVVLRCREVAERRGVSTKTLRLELPLRLN